MASRAPTGPAKREDVRRLVASVDERVWNFLESVPDAMVLSDPSGRILWVNTNTERMFGYSRDELIGKEVELLVSERSRNAHRTDRMTYYAEPSIRRMGVGRELSARGKDGLEFPVEISLSPTQIRGETLVWSAIRDISDRERFIVELREAMQKKQLVLGGLISICSWCRRVQDEGTWLPLETYVASRSQAKFTHGICAECLATLELNEHKHDPNGQKLNPAEPKSAAGSSHVGPRRRQAR